MVSSKDCGVAPPQIPFSYRISSSSHAIGSAFCVIPIPATCKHFISESKTIQKCKNPSSLKISIPGMPLTLTYLIISQQT